MKAVFPLLITLAVTVMAQPQRPPGGSGPADHKVLSASSPDGLTWTRDEGVRIEHASVPCVVTDGDQRVLIYYVAPPTERGMTENVTCSASTDGMHFERQPFQIEGMTTVKGVDPSILRDEEGKYLLYYLASDSRGDPASAPGLHAIHLAMSDDGIKFREMGAVFRYANLVDPDVFQFKEQWFMYVFAGRSGTVIATSKDGKDFTYSCQMTPRNWGTTAPVLLPDGRLRLYAFQQGVPVGNAVGSFLSTDGLNWTAEPGERLKAAKDEQITDPFVVRWKGGYKMYFKASGAPGRGIGMNQPGKQPFRERDADTRPLLPEGERTAGGRAEFDQGIDSTARVQGFPPLPKGEGRGEGEQDARGFQQPNNFNSQEPLQNRNSDGPWNHDVIVYRAGRDGTGQRVASFERAGVPTLARLKDGRLIAAYQCFPENDPASFDKVAVQFSSDEGSTWTKAEVIQLTGLPEGMRFPFDPTLVSLPDGRVRLYFTGNMGRTFGPSTPAIHSAISANGLTYTYEPGTRFSVEGRAVIDCAVALHQGVFHLFSPDNGAGPDPGRNERSASVEARPREGIGYHATSDDGLNFTRVADVQIEGRRRWLGNAQSDGNVITFFGTGAPMTSAGRQQRGGLWMATSKDGAKWQLTESPAVGGADPGAVAARDGGWIILATGEPRAGSARAGQAPDRFQPRSRDGTMPSPEAAWDANSDWSSGRAVGRGTVRFTHAPMRLEDVEHLVPYGLMVGGHVCPIDHGYFYPKPLKPGQQHFDVTAPADGFVVVVSHRTQLTGSTEREREYDDYALILEHSGTFYSQYDLLTQLDRAILDQLDDVAIVRFAMREPGPPIRTRIPIKAGQVIGRVGGRSLDFSVVNTEVQLKGFLTPALYGHYAWRIHVVDPLEFFDEPLRSKLQALNVRKVPPYFGKIDYDVDGQLIGNWFREGNGGYSGDRSDPRGYWTGHLAFAPHHIDPTKIVVSIGAFGGRPAQFWVKGNSPDPANVSGRDGMMKYELVLPGIGSNGQRYEGIDTNSIQGIALAQVLPGRRLKFEVFPGSNTTAVHGFSNAAKTYER